MDEGHYVTELILKETEEDVARVYRQAAEETQKKLDDYLRKFQTKDEIKRRQLKAGEITKAEYDYWKTGQIMIGKRWEEMRDTLATDLHNANKLARSIVEGHMPDVYATNHNYATFQIEKGSLLDTSYTLYDRDTVERIIRDQPDLLPPPGPRKKASIAAGKDIAWQRGQIQSVTLQSILQGESIPNMAKRIATTMGETNMNSAVRYARTATTGAENAGRVDAYERAELMGIELEQEWLATLDGRTRHSHRQLDGEAIGVNTGEVFSNGCRYPGDPKGPPWEIWNCRCTLVPRVKGVDQSDAPRNSKLGSMTYEEWRNEHTVEKEEPAGKTWKDKVDRVKGRIAKNGGVITSVDLHEAGAALADEYGKVERQIMEIEAAVAAKMEPINQNLAVLRKEMEKVSGELDDKWNMWRRGEISREEYESERERLNSKYEELRKKDRELRDERSSILNESKRSQDEDIKWLSDKISEVRNVGGREGDMKAHFGGSRSAVRSSIEKAYSNYPSDWVNQSVDFGKIQPKKVERGYYAHRTSYPSELAISGYNEASCLETAFHELGHRFEAINKGILDAEREFYNRRTAGESLVWLGKGYSRNEVTRKDNFVHGYMGKDYGGDAYELVSMGFEYAYTNPRKLAKDRDMQEWIYGILLLE